MRLGWGDGAAWGRGTLIQGPRPPPPSPHPRTPCSPTDGACAETTTTFSSKHIGVRLSPPLQEDSGFGAMSFKWITCSAGGGADTTMKAMSLKCSCGLQPRSLPRRLDVPGGDDAPQERISVLPVVSPRSFDDQCELPPKRPGGLFWPSTNNGSSSSPRGLVTSMAAVCPRGQKRAGGKAGGDKPPPRPSPTFRVAKCLLVLAPSGPQTLKAGWAQPRPPGVLPSRRASLKRHARPMKAGAEGSPGARPPAQLGLYGVLRNAWHLNNMEIFASPNPTLFKSPACPPCSTW